MTNALDLMLLVPLVSYFLLKFGTRVSDQIDLLIPVPL